MKTIAKKTRYAYRENQHDVRFNLIHPIKRKIKSEKKGNLLLRRVARIEAEIF